MTTARLRAVTRTLHSQHEDHNRTVALFLTIGLIVGSIGNKDSSEMDQM